MTKQSRVKTGVPAGGEFAATAHAEPTLGLDAPVPFPILAEQPPSPVFQAATLDVVMRRGERLPSLDPGIQIIHAANPPQAATPPPTSPAAVLAAALGTDKDPNSIPWPEKPANSVVEVFVDPDDLCGIMDNGNWNAATGYTEVYASIDLISDRDCDFWGIDAEGNEHVIALGIHDYEEAVDPYNHENLRYREGFSDPMPAHNAARAEVKALRLEASSALLAESGITVELEDLRRGHYRLKRGTAPNIRLEIDDFAGARLTETTNWHSATDEHYDAFLDGPSDQPTRELLDLSATLVARDLKDKGYKELYGR